MRQVMVDGMSEIFQETQTFIKYYPNELTEEICKPIFKAVFDKLEIEPDDLIYFNEGKVKLSSLNQGIIEWDDKENSYVRMYYMQKYSIGNLKYILVKKGDEK